MHASLYRELSYDLLKEQHIIKMNILKNKAIYWHSKNNGEGFKPIPLPFKPTEEESDLSC